MKYLTLLCVISIFFLVCGCSKGSAEEVEIYSIRNDTEPTQVIKEEDVVKQIEELTTNLNEVPIEEAISNAKGNPDVIFQINGSKWFVYYVHQKAILRKNAGTFFNASDEQANKLKSLFGKDV